MTGRLRLLLGAILKSRNFVALREVPAVQNCTYQSEPVAVVEPAAAVVRHPVVAHFLQPYNRSAVLGFLADLFVAAVIPADWRPVGSLVRSAMPAAIYSETNRRDSLLAEHSVAEHSAHYPVGLPKYRQPVTH